MHMSFSEIQRGVGFGFPKDKVSHAEAAQLPAIWTVRPLTGTGPDAAGPSRKTGQPYHDLAYPGKGTCESDLASSGT